MCSTKCRWHIYLSILLGPGVVTLLRMLWIWWGLNYLMKWQFHNLLQPTSVSNSCVENGKISRAIDNWWSQLSIQRPNEVGTFWWKIVGISDEKWSQIICLKVKLWPARTRWYEWKSSLYKTCKNSYISLFSYKNTN